VIQDPKSAFINIFDGEVKTLSFKATDYEKSPYLQFLKRGTWPDWADLITLPLKPDHSIDCTLQVSPNTKRSGVYTLELEAFDGAMSTSWVITVTVTYDPPVVKQGLQDAEVKVGRII
jgi:hypothetical protein